ncbi:MAG TPA: ribonuclease HII [Candidatus Thermoplasmatota archaeon]
MLVGIDEAGRGPVFGPLVVAGVLGIDQEAFRALGVKDSKLLSPKRRKEIEPEIRKLATRVVTVVVSADDIDGRRNGGEENLNEIEVVAFGKIAKRLAGTELYLDAADVNAERFGKLVAKKVGRRSPYTKIVSEHRGDTTYPIVSAASVVAKVRRDREVRRLARPLEKELGLPFGSGYSHDETTRAFLESYRVTFGKFPTGTRHSWDTVRAMESRLLTRRLEDFLSSAEQGRPSPL